MWEHSTLDKKILRGGKFYYSDPIIIISFVSSLIRNCRFENIFPPHLCILNKDSGVNRQYSSFFVVSCSAFVLSCTERASVSPKQRAETVDSSRPPRQDSSNACFCLVCTLFLLSSSLCEAVVGFCFIFQIRASVFSLIRHKTEGGM
jgi:hypothetical protein